MPNLGTCPTADCGRPAKCAGLCQRCYDRKRRRGSVNAPVRRAPLEYWLEKSRLSDPTACWPWKGYINEQGYGRVYALGALRSAHRTAYQKWVGQIPDGMTIDHRCHNDDPICAAGNNWQHRRCINPAHMDQWKASRTRAARFVSAGTTRLRWSSLGEDGIVDAKHVIVRRSGDIRRGVMLGRSHMLSGLCVGLAIAPHIGFQGAVPVLMFATVTAAASLAPDIDHPGSTVSRCAGVLSGSVSRLARFVSRRIYLATRTPQDRKSRGTHRMACHSLPLFAVPVGAVVTALAAWRGAPLWLGLAVALGCFTHDLGDDLTEGLVPWLAPFKIGGQRWRELPITPRWMRFKTGKWFEHLFVTPAFTVLAVLLLPGVLPLVLNLWHQARGNGPVTAVR